MLWAEAGDMAVELAAVDMMDVDLTAATDVEDMTVTVVDMVTTSQAQPHSSLRPALKKTPLTA